MFEVLIIFRDLSPGPATSKNKWVSAFKSVRGKPENQRFFKCHDLLIIHHHNIVFFRIRLPTNHLSPRHKNLMKTLSSTNLERGRGAGLLEPTLKDSASTYASPDRSSLTVENQTLASSSGWSQRYKWRKIALLRIYHGVIRPLNL